MAEDLWRFFRNSFFHLSSLRLSSSSFPDLYHPFLLTHSSCIFFSMSLTVFGIFCSSYRWEFIQSSFFLPVSLHVIILLLFSFFVAIYENTNLKMNFLIVFFRSYREFLLSFSPPPSHSLFLYFFFFFSFLFLIHWILKHTMNSLICRFLYRWEFAYFYQPPFPLLYLHPISALPHFWSTPWYIFINNRVENSRHPICQQAERVEFIPVRFQKAERRYFRWPEAARKMLSPAVSRWKAALDRVGWSHLPSRDEENTFVEDVTRDEDLERENAWPRGRGSRGFFAEAKVLFLGLVKGNSEDDDFYFRLPSSETWHRPT